MSRECRNAMIEITNRHGHSEPILHLAASIGWNSKWDPEAMQEHTARVGKLLAEAASIMEMVEAEEQKRGEVEKMYGKQQLAH